MRRRTLFEFNDLPGAPAFVRDTVVESLSRTLEWGRVLDGLVEPFSSFVHDAGVKEVLDIGSGAGGPARILARAIARTAKPPVFVLTDLHPRVAAWERVRADMPGAIDFVKEPVDATRIPDAIAAGRARTIINVLHHFPPDLARAILEDAVRGGRGVFIAEAFERNPLLFLNFAVAGLPALLANPILSPEDRALKAAFTYLTPAALGISVWDGVVSALRMYTENELRELVAPFGASWRWTYGTFTYFPRGRGYFFHGVPR